MRNIFYFIIGFGIGYWATSKLNIKRRLSNEVYQIILNSDDKDKIFKVLRKKPHLIKYLNQTVNNIHTYLKQKIIDYSLEIEKNLFEDELLIKIKVQNNITPIELIELEGEFFYNYFNKFFEYIFPDLNFRFERI